MMLNRHPLTFLGAVIGATIGTYLPMYFFNVELMSYWCIIGSIIGGCLGTICAYKIGQYFSE